MSLFRGVRAVLFDFDDTLVASSAADAAAMRATLDRFAPLFPGAAIEELERHQGEILADVKRVFHDTGVWAYPPERLGRLLRERGQDASPATGMGEYYYAERLRRLSPFPGARELVIDLRARGYRVGLVTNGPAVVQRRTLASLGFLDAVDAVAIAGEERVRKPNPRLFELARSRLGVEVAPRETLVVGDSFEMDMVPARALGMRTAYVAGAAEDARSHLFDDGVRPPDGSVDVTVARAAELGPWLPPVE